MRTWQRRIGIALLLSLAAAESTASLTDKRPHIPPNFNSFSPPPVGQSYEDPVFGETVIRGTDALNMASPGPFQYLSAEYSSSAVTNADDSYVRLTDNGGASDLFSLPDFTFFRRLTLGSSSPSDYWWNVDDPNLLYAVPDNRLDVYDIAADRISTVHTFPEFGNIVGMGESNLSHDGNRLALHGRFPSSGPEQLLIYEFSSDSVIASLDLSKVPGFFDASIAPSGQRVVIAIFPGGGGSGHFEVWNIDEAAGTLTQGIVLPEGAGHNDKTLGPDGKDYMIMVDSWFTNTLYRVNLEDGSRRILIEFGWTIGIPLGLHVSANSMDKDGWIYLSTYIDNDFDPDPNQLWIPYIGEIMRVRWDGATVERLAHNRTQMLSYWNIPRATVSTSGRYLFWSSNFRRNHVPNATADYADVYFMDLSRLSSVPPPPPAAPSSLRAEARFSGGTLELGTENRTLFLDRQWALVALSWRDNSQDEDSFQIFRREGSQSGFELIADLDANRTAFKDRVDTGLEHCYRVFAHNNGGRSVSNEVCLNLDG